ncbi:MAG: polyhydroxyalkanoic acid system family protein [Casimicrobiaceae bacterium]
MPTIAIKRRHELDPKKARAAAQQVAGELSSRYQLACSWSGDDVAFERPGVSGCMHVGKSEVRLDVQLSFLMTPLKGAIERAINDELDRLFGDRAGRT